MTKKVLAIFMAISMALSFSACGGDKNNSDSSTAEVTTTAASETTITTEKPIEFEITDWKFTDISQNISVNGIKFSIPCKISDLPDGVTYKEQDKIEEVSGVWLKHIGLISNGEQFAEADVIVEDDKKIRQNDYVKTLLIFSNIHSQENTFVFGKITEKSTREEVENIYGKSNFNASIKTINFYKFNNNEKGIVLMFFDACPLQESIRKKSSIKDDSTSNFELNFIVN